MLLTPNAGVQAVIQITQRNGLTASVNATLARPSLERASSESLGPPNSQHNPQRSADGFPGFLGEPTA